jgi:hypothetical protein
MLGDPLDGGKVELGGEQERNGEHFEVPAA